jgi:UDP-N-acetylglucosamine 2-epimerase (non-hydrolysing)
MAKKICIILGTRPEIIKMSPLIRECEEQGLEYFIVHSGQHYSYEMDRIFFDELKLPEAKYKLEVGKEHHGEQTAEILVGVESVLQKERPDVVLVEGDTNTVLAGALGAVKLHVKVGHVEAGLRSWDRRMPEEINRILTDHCSDWLFAPTEVSKGNLLKEGVPEERITVTGNTVVDALYQNLDIAKKSIEPRHDDYFLVTFHRAENVDSKENLEKFVKILENLDQTIIFPIHPRTEKRLQEFGLYERVQKIKNLEITEPLGYLEFLVLEANAKLVLTDSGGIQEEACILRVPCVTLRENTERPETVEVGANVIAGLEPENVLKSVETMLGKGKNWDNPFGEVGLSKKIVDIVK